MKFNMTIFTNLIFCFALLGCAAMSMENYKSLSTNKDIADEVVKEFLEGKLMLTCDTGCSFTYGYNREDLKSHFDAKNWVELSKLVISINYRTDQAYFYLATAAEGLGYENAAIAYYKLALYGDGIKCDEFINTCDGINVASLSYSALQRLRYVN